MVFVIKPNIIQNDKIKAKIRVKNHLNHGLMNLYPGVGVEFITVHSHAHVIIGFINSQSNCISILLLPSDVYLTEGYSKSCALIISGQVNQTLDG